MFFKTTSIKPVLPHLILVHLIFISKVKNFAVVLVKKKLLLLSINFFNLEPASFILFSEQECVFLTQCNTVFFSIASDPFGQMLSFNYCIPFMGVIPPDFHYTITICPSVLRNEAQLVLVFPIF